MEEALVLQPWEAVNPHACIEFYERNREHLAPWEPRRDQSFYTLKHQVALQDTFARQRAADRHYAFGVFLGDQLAGRVALSDVVRGVFQGAHVGYLTDAAQCGRGIATRAVHKVMEVAFSELGLHRLQAAVIPRNHASVRVVMKCGFKAIGLSPFYLLINDRWEDHMLFALTVEDFSGGSSPL
jgi:ribosomal-protein-alanine N-acetyltransferase